MASLIENESEPYRPRMTFAKPNESLSFGEAMADKLPFAALGPVAGPITEATVKLGRNILANPKDFGEMVSASFRQTDLVEGVMSKSYALELAYDKQIADLKALTGVELENPLRGGYHQEVERANRQDIRLRSFRADQEPAEPLTSVAIFDRKMRELIANHPDAPGLIDLPEEAKNISREAEKRLEDARRETKLNLGASLTAQFIGGFAGQYRDPLFVGTLFLGPSTAVGKTVAARIATAGLAQGFFNAGTAAVAQPVVQAWRNEIGTTNGVWPAMENVGMAFLFGLIPGAALRGVHEGLVANRAKIAHVIEGTASDAEIDAVLALGRQVQRDIDRSGAAPFSKEQLQRSFGMNEQQAATMLARMENGWSYEAALGAHFDDPFARAPTPPTPERAPVEERAVQLGREMDAAQKATQLPPVKETSPAMPERFITSQGSSYVVHEDGTTTRTKAARDTPGHEGDFGEKERSERTIFLDSAELAGQLSAAGLQNMPPQGARVILKDGHAILMIWSRKTDYWGRSSTAIPYSDTPGVGKAPLELWGKQSDIQGYPESYSNMHAGNAITDHQPARAAEYADGKTPEQRDALVDAETNAGESPLTEPTASAVEEVENIITKNVSTKKRGPAGRDPETWSLLEFMASRGGIKQTDALIGDVLYIFDGKNPFIPGFGRLIRKTGKSLDNHLEAAVEPGNSYLYDPGALRGGGQRTTTIADLLDAMSGEAAGKKVYKHGRDPEHVTAAKEEAARERYEHELDGQVMGAVRELGMTELPEKTRNRAVEIMMKEGETDPVSALERAYMEESYYGETASQHESVTGIPDWDAVPDDAGPALATGELPPTGGLGGLGEGARTFSASDPTSPLSNAIADRIAEANPQSKREAQMAATEAMEDIARERYIERTTDEVGQPALPSPPPEQRIPPRPPLSEEPGGNDPLDLARKGELTSQRATEIMKELRARWKAIEDAVLGEDADAWRQAHKRSDRFWDNAEDEKAKEQDAIVAAIEAKHPQEDIDRLYGTAADDRGHVDPEGWKQLARDLEAVEHDRKTALRMTSEMLRRLPQAGKEPSELDRATLAVIQHAMNMETQRGGDPAAFIRDAFTTSKRRYGGGPDAEEIVRDDMERLQALLRNPPKPVAEIAPPPIEPMHAPKDAAPFDTVPITNERGQLEYYTRDQIANFGKREDWIADIVTECK